MYKMIYLGRYMEGIFETVANFSKIQLCGYIIDPNLSEEDFKHSEDAMKNIVGGGGAY